MRCSTCGAEVAEEAVFCHQCGGRLQGVEANHSFDKPDAARQKHADSPEGAGTPARVGPPAGDQPGGAAGSTPADRLRAAAERTGGEEEQEEELWEGGYSSRAMAGNWVLSAMITLVLLLIWAWKVRNGTAWAALVVGLLLLWIVQLLLLVYRRMSVHYELTTQRLVHQKGILRRVTDRIELIDVDDITFEQGVIDRLTGVGTIRVISSDRTHPELLLRGIESVGEVATVIDDARRAERRRRGLHIEAI